MTALGLASLQSVPASTHASAPVGGTRHVSPMSVRRTRPCPTVPTPGAGSRDRAPTRPDAPIDGAHASILVGASRRPGTPGRSGCGLCRVARVVRPRSACPATSGRSRTVVGGSVPAVAAVASITAVRLRCSPARGTRCASHAAGVPIPCGADPASACAPSSRSRRRPSGDRGRTRRRGRASSRAPRRPRRRGLARGMRVPRHAPSSRTGGRTPSGRRPRRRSSNRTSERARCLSSPRPACTTLTIAVVFASDARAAVWT